MSKIPSNYSTITYRAGLPVAFDEVPVVPVQGCPVKDGGVRVVATALGIVTEPLLLSH